MSWNEQDRYWMSQALQLAADAGARFEVPVGAVVVRDQVLLGQAGNAPISACDPTAHAEILALRQACQAAGNYRLPGATLYVTVEPCAMCSAAMVHARIERLVYGTEEPKAGSVVSAQQFFQQKFLNHQVLFEGGCLAAESRRLMQDFFSERRRAQRRRKQHSAE